MTLREVRVPLRRLNIYMTEDAFETPDVSNLDLVPGGERVTEIVKTDLRDLGRAYQLRKVKLRADAVMTTLCGRYQVLGDQLFPNHPQFQRTVAADPTLLPLVAMLLTPSDPVVRAASLYENFAPVVGKFD